MSERDESTQSDDYMVSMYLDGALTEDEARRLLARVERDTELARLLAEHQRVERWATEWGDEIPTVDWSRFEAESRRRRASLSSPDRRGLVFKLYVPMAAAAAIMIALTASQFVVRDVSPGVVIAPRVAVVEVLRSAAPESVEVRQTYVSYARGSRDDRAKGLVRSADGPAVIACATVGGRFDWSSVGGGISAN